MSAPLRPDAARRERIGDDPVHSGLAVARAAQRVGELDVAEATLAELHAAYPANAEVAGSYARMLITQARYEEARDVASAGGPLTGLRAEAAGLAAFHLGALDAADAAFAALEVEAASSGDAAAAGHAGLLRGMVARHRGQLGLASDRYGEAARRLAEAGERHAAAAAELELGGVLIERGRASEALPWLDGASHVLAEPAGTAEACLVALRRAGALLQVGQLDSAKAAAATALARATTPQLRARALIVAGDVARRLADEPAALHGYREALAIAAGHGDTRGQLRAHVALAETGQRDGDGIGAAIDALCASDDDRDTWTLARGRLALRDPSSMIASAAAGTPGDATATLARACAGVAARAVDDDRLERAFRGHALAAQLAVRARDPSLAREQAARARLAHAALIAATAPAFRAAIDGDPDLARLPGGELSPAPRSASDAAHAAPPGSSAPLRRLLALARRLATEPSLERIFDDVIDAALELTGAERGLLLLRRPDGELAIVASRNCFDDDPDEPGSAGPVGAARRSAARSIAERVAQSGETVLTVDAAIQSRTVAQRLRSVLAVPLRQRGAITGSLYVDHRVRSGAFDAPTAAVLGELADLAAIAIENARRTADLRRAIAEADERSGHLAAELARHDDELLRLTAELAAAQARPEPTRPVVGDDLRLRPALAAIEQAYLTAAMARAAGNQTAAARLLGLSRFGLQKKLRRQADGGGDDGDDGDDGTE